MSTTTVWQTCDKCGERWWDSHICRSTVTVRYNCGAAETEEAIRNKLIELGWAPPGQAPDDTALLRQALEALELALSSHGVLLLSDPPQDAWKTRGVDGKGREVIASLRQRLAM